MIWVYVGIGIAVGAFVLWFLFNRGDSSKESKEPWRSSFRCAPSPLLGADIKRMDRLINEARLADGRVALQACRILRNTSNEVAEYLDRGGEWSHQYYRDVIAPGLREQFEGISTGEILGREYKSVDAVFDAWMESDSHRRVLLFPRYRYYGWRRVGEYWVMHFAY